MIKTLAAHIKEYKLPSIMTPLSMIVEVLMEMVVPLLMASMIDDGISKGDLSHVLFTGGLMIVCAIVGLLGGLGGAIWGSKASCGFARNLRKAMYEKVQGYSFSNIDRFSTASLVTRMTTDVTNVQNAYMMLLRMCFRAPFSIIIAMIMAFTISPELATIYLGAIIVLSIILAILIRFAMKYFNQVFKRYDELNSSVQENVNAIRVVKANVREDYEKQKFKKASKNIYDMFCKAEGIIAYNPPVMNLAVYTCIILISWFGAHLVVGGSLLTGQLTSLLTYCMNILMNLMMLSIIFVMSTMAVASAKRIAEVLEEEPDIKNPEDPVYDVKDGSVVFENVCFSYNRDSKEYVLKDIDLEIRSGETIGIIGGTGSSKTSLVNLISRLYDVSEGCVKVGGRDVREYDLTTLRDSVSVVLQKNVLFSGTILENLRWGNKDATLEECKRACRLACADEFIEAMPDKYDTYIEQGGTNVSGGQKQRLCIARALLKKPKVLILDDSTSAVDTATDAKIRAAFASEIADTTKFIIAQRIGSVMGADRIIVLDNGEVKGFGTHEELLAANDIYREVYETQTKGGGDFDENGGGN